MGFSNTLLNNTLLNKIEKFFERLKITNLFYIQIFSGTMTTLVFKNYLENIQFVLEQTCLHLSLASQECAKRDWNELKAFYDNKIGEEQGHHNWAKQDMENLIAIDPACQKFHGLDPAIVTVMTRNESLIQKDPVLWLAYILFAEYFTVIAGREIVPLLQTKSNIPETCMTCISRHVELDRHHVAEMLEGLEKFADEKIYYDAFEEVLEESFQLYDRFCNNLVVGEGCDAA